MRYTKTDQAEARELLKKYLKPKTVVYTKLKHVSSSGMSRVIDLFVIKKNEPIRLTWAVAALCDYSYDRKYEGLKVGGCGMDMGFAVVHDLGYTMWPKGTKKPHGTRNGEPDTDGGYALSQRWL
jgi:hypothetical protein